MKKSNKNNKAEKSESNIFGYAFLIFIFSTYFILIPILIFGWEAVLVFYGILAFIIYNFWAAYFKEVKPHEVSDSSIWDTYVLPGNGWAKRRRKKREEEDLY